MCWGCSTQKSSQNLLVHIEAPAYRNVRKMRLFDDLAFSIHREMRQFGDLRFMNAHKNAMLYGPCHKKTICEMRCLRNTPVRNHCKTQNIEAQWCNRKCSQRVTLWWFCTQNPSQETTRWGSWIHECTQDAGHNWSCTNNEKAQRNVMLWRSPTQASLHNLTRWGSCIQKCLQNVHLW